MADTLSQALLEASLLSSIPEEDDGSVIIDVDRRTMVLPTGFFFGVYNDKDVLKVPFVIPRYYNELDLSEFQITVNYINSAGYGNIYRVTDAEVTDSAIRFKWVTGRGVFVKEGTIRFIVCLRQIGSNGEVEKEFNTTIASANVLKGLEVDENPDPIAYSILAHMEELKDQAEAAVEVVEGAADRIDDAVTEAEQAIAAMYHSPYIAPTAADMLSHDKVYVYTGNETGYTFGNWYYWNGSAFVSGGVYNATAFETDATLTQSGKAADAKKTGDEISGLKEDLSGYNGTLVEGKYINRHNGEISTDIAGANYVEFDVSEGMAIDYRYTIAKPDTRGIAFYDTNGSKVESYQTLTTEQTLIVPQNAVLCRATASGIGDIIISSYNVAIHTLETATSHEIDIVKNKGVHDKTTNYINPNNVASGYINNSGTYVKSSTWYNTGFVKLEQGVQYYFYGIYAGGYYAFYDENKELLQASGGETLTNPFTIPSQAVYAIFSKNSNITSSNWIYTEDSAPPTYADIPYEDAFVAQNQGAENAGKLLSVDDDGSVILNNEIVYMVHDPETNYINLANVAEGHVSNTTGKIVKNGSWHNTGVVSLEAGKSYYFSGLYSGSAGYYAFYDSEGTPVLIGNSELPNPFTVPDDAAYGIFSRNGDIVTSWIYTENSAPADYGLIQESGLFVKKNQGVGNAGKVLGIGDDGVVVPTSLSDGTEYAEIELWQKGNLYKESELVVDKYIYKTGDERSYSNYRCTPFLPVSGYVYLNGFLSTYYAFYNESKTLVASYDTLGDMEQWTPGIKRVAVPVGAVYGRFSANKLPSSYAFISCEPENPLPYDRDSVKDAYPLTFNPENPCDCESGSVTLFHKVVCIGDSLTWGAFNTNGDETINVPSANTLHEWYSYPTYFTKITGVQTTNMGDSSETFKTWYELYGSTDFSGHDCAIIHLGVNDASFDRPDEETAEYLCAIVDALKASVMGIKIFVCTVTPVFSNDRFPTHKQKSQVIRDTIAENYGSDPDVVLVDIERYSYVRQYTSYAAGHFTALGYWRFAKDVSNFMSWHIDHHMRDYRFVHFIGSDRTYSGD